MGKILMLCLLVSATCFSQSHMINGERKGLLQVTASIYPSRMLNHAISNMYVAGHANYYFTDEYAFRGEVMHYIDAQGDNKYIKRHTQLQAAFGRHFPVNRFDPYVYASVGLAGISLTERPHTYFQPVAGIITGSHFQFSDYIYFFVEMQYQHMSDPLHKRPLDQLFFSGGIGIQFPTGKSD